MLEDKSLPNQERSEGVWPRFQVSYQRAQVQSLIHDRASREGREDHAAESFQEADLDADQRQADEIQTEAAQAEQVYGQTYIKR